MGNFRFETILDFSSKQVDVAVRCDGCRRVRYLTAAQVADIFGIACRIVTAERRLRCSQCGHKGAKLAPIPRLE